MVFNDIPIEGTPQEFAEFLKTMDELYDDGPEAHSIINVQGGNLNGMYDYAIGFLGENVYPASLIDSVQRLGSVYVQQGYVILKNLPTGTGEAKARAILRTTGNHDINNWYVVGMLNETVSREFIDNLPDNALVKPPISALHLNWA